MREVRGRSAPGTPGRKTTIKIRKTTTISTAGSVPTLQNITEVSVASKSPAKELSSGKSKGKQEIKLTFSKVSPVKRKEKSMMESPVKIVKIPAMENSAILKPNINKSHTDKNESKKQLEFHSTTNPIKEDNEAEFDLPSNQNVKFSSVSEEFGSGMTKFMKAEMAAHQKVEEIWMEKNNTENPNLNSKMEQQKKPLYVPQSTNPTQGYISSDLPELKKPEVAINGNQIKNNYLQSSINHMYSDDSQQKNNQNYPTNEQMSQQIYQVSSSQQQNQQHNLPKLQQNIPSSQRVTP